MKLNLTIFNYKPLWIKASGDIAAGWTKNEKGFGVFGRGAIGYRGNRSFAVTVNVRVRPYQQFSFFTSFPLDVELGGDLILNGSVIGVYAVRGGKCAVLIPADELGTHLEHTEGNLTSFEHVVLMSDPNRVHVRMTVSTGVLSAPEPPIGDIPEWDTQFFQGGLPSLGKRRP